MNKPKIKRKSEASITLGECYNTYIHEKKASGVSDDCIVNYDTVFMLFCRDNNLTEDTPAENICEDTIYNWIDSMKQRKLKPESINSYLSRCRTFLYWCMRKGYMESFKVTLLKHQEEAIKYYTDDELKILLKKPKADCSFREYRTWVITCFIMSTGARVGTISNIKLTDIDLKAHTVTYTHLKNKKLAIIPLSSSMCSILNEYLCEWNLEDCEYLFSDVGAGKLTSSAIRQSLNKYCKDRGVQQLGPHALRHSFARGWIKNGGGVFQLQQMLTHTDLEMTRRYVRLFSEDLADDVKQFSPLDSLRKSNNTHRIKSTRWSAFLNFKAFILEKKGQHVILYVQKR